MIAHIFMSIERAKHAFNRRMVPDNCKKRFSDLTIVANGKVVEVYMVEDMDRIKGLELSNAYFDEAGSFNEKFIHAVQSRIRII